MSTTTELAAYRATWLAERRQGIGGSDVAGVLGLSLWSSPWTVWASKVGLIKDDDPTEAMEFGLRAEPMLKAYFEDRTGLYVHGEQTVAVHPDHPWMRCTLDGYVHLSHDASSRVGVYEAKTTGDSPAEWEHEVPVYYQTQAGWSMAVTGTDHCWFGVLHLAFGRPQFRVYEFARDDQDISTMTAACRNFWHDHVLTGIAPEADGSDATTGAIRDAYPDSDPDAMIDVGDLPEHHLLFKAARLRNAKAELKKLELAVAADENAIKAALADRSVLTNGLDLKGRPVVVASWKPQKRTDLDRAGLRAAHPDVADLFTKTTTIRVLRIGKE